MGLPLDGVRVIEVGQALAGPLAGVRASERKSLRERLGSLAAAA